jgi:hypothetical protein
MILSAGCAAVAGRAAGWMFRSVSLIIGAEIFQICSGVQIHAVLYARLSSANIPTSSFTQFSPISTFQELFGAYAEELPLCKAHRLLINCFLMDTMDNSLLTPMCVSFHTVVAVLLSGSYKPAVIPMMLSPTEVSVVRSRDNDARMRMI